MNEFDKKWIWIKEESDEENIVGCFVDVFSVNSVEEVELAISADSRYILYINGSTVGSGPIRGDKDNWFYDTYNISRYLKKGENFIAIRVWSYGLSNYQYISNKAGLMYQVSQKEEILTCSSYKTKSSRDLSIKSNTLKRNVNLGFMEFCDATRFDNQWISNCSVSSCWEESKEIDNSWGILKRRPIKHYSQQFVYPHRIISIEGVKNTTQQVSINLRKVFFPNRKDANSTLFSGFLATTIEAKEDLQGKIDFPFRTWNGIIGSFKINDVFYQVSDECRSINVMLHKGKNLFLLEISGKFDDVFFHADFDFPHEISFSNPFSKCNEPFVALGPTTVLEEKIDGKEDIYGGLVEFGRLTQLPSYHVEIFTCKDIQDLCKWKDDFIVVPSKYIFFGENIYSVVKNSVVQKRYPITEADNGLLWDNTEKTVLLPSQDESDMRIILDMGDIYVGEYEIELEAGLDTRLEIYGFENMFKGEIDYTVGLNNSIIYICKQGYQKHRFMTRMGARYLAITVKNQKEPLSLINIRQRHSTYAPSNQGSFRCSDYLLNKIWDISAHTHVLCMEDVFTDCPTYEQSFWIGDAQISANVNALLYGEYSLIKHCLNLTTLMKKNTPLLNALGPTDWNTSIPMWTMNWLLSIKQYVEYTNDIQILTELYKDIKETLYYYSSFITDDDLFLISAWNMLDWAPLDISNHCVVTGQQSILAYCFRYYAQVATELGMKDDAAFYIKSDQRLLEGIDKILWDSNQKMFLDGWSPEKGFSTTVSIQTHTLLFLFDGIKDTEKQKIVKTYMLDKPKEFIDVGSPFMLFYVYEVLAKFNNLEAILNDIKIQWGKMLDYDSTTCWEVFPGFYEVGRTRSYCHSWSSSPVYFLNKYVLGISEIEEGWNTIRLKMPNTSLKWCEGCVPTPHGTIYIRWDLDNEKYMYKMTAPSSICIEFDPVEDWNIEIISL